MNGIMCFSLNNILTIILIYFFFKYIRGGIVVVGSGVGVDIIFESHLQCGVVDANFAK